MQVLNPRALNNATKPHSVKQQKLVGIRQLPNAMSRSKGLEKQLQLMIGLPSEVSWEGQGADKDRSEIASSSMTLRTHTSPIPWT